MHQASGGCHCGNISVELQLTVGPESYRPRACDCDFCRKHGAAYVSDVKGLLAVRIKDERERSTYRQGSGQAEFLLCRNCGVLVGAFLRSGSQIHATINVKALANSAAFAPELAVSPQKLAGDQKVQRWQDLWFPNVTFTS